MVLKERVVSRNFGTRLRAESILPLSAATGSALFNPLPQSCIPSATLRRFGLLLASRIAAASDGASRAEAHTFSELFGTTEVVP